MHVKVDAKVGAGSLVPSPLRTKLLEQGQRSLAQVGKRSVVHQNVVCPPPLLDRVHLHRHDPAHLGLVQPTMVHEPAQTLIRWGVHHYDDIELRVQACLEEEWNLGYHEGIALSAALTNPHISQLLDAGVEDALETAPGGFVLKHTGTHVGSVEGSVRSKHPVSESLQYIRQAFAPWSNRPPRQFVGANDGNPGIRPESRHL